MYKAIALAVGIAALALQGCQKGSTTEVVVGEFASLTGKEATFGISAHEARMLAVEEVNAAGGVLGKKIKLLTEDDQSKAGESATVVNKLISQDGVVAILGEVASSRSLEAAPICQANRSRMISPASTNPKVTETRRLHFPRLLHRSLPRHGDGEVRAQDTQGRPRGRLHRREERLLARASRNISRKASPKNGGTDRRASSITTAATRISRPSSPPSRPRTRRACWSPAITPRWRSSASRRGRSASMCRSSAAMAGRARSWSKIGKEAVEGTYFSTHYSPDAGSPKGKEFVEAYQKRYHGKVPDAMAALGYDSAMMLFDAIKRAGSTEGPKVRDAIAATKDFRRHRQDHHQRAARRRQGRGDPAGQGRQVRYVETVAPLSDGRLAPPATRQWPGARAPSMR